MQEQRTEKCVVVTREKQIPDANAKRFVKSDKKK